jgi:hypothetical protein
MIHLTQLSATSRYWHTAEQAERERDARRADLAREARNLAAVRPEETRRSGGLVLRLAGALGLA